MSPVDFAALANPELYREIAMCYPRLGFAHIVAVATREVVQRMKEHLHESDARLQIRLEPRHDALDSRGRPRPPQRLVIRDGDCFWRVPVDVLENGILIGDRLVTTGEDCINRIAAEFVRAIKATLGIPNDVSGPAHMTPAT